MLIFLQQTNWPIRKWEGCGGRRGLTSCRNQPLAALFPPADSPIAPDRTRPTVTPAGTAPALSTGESSEKGAVWVGGGGRGGMSDWRGERRETDLDCVNQLMGAQLTFAGRALCLDGHSVISLSIVGARPSFSGRSGGGRGHAARKATAKDRGSGRGVSTAECDMATNQLGLSSTSSCFSRPLTVPTVDTNHCTSASVDILKPHTKKMIFPNKAKHELQQHQLGSQTRGGRKKRIREILLFTFYVLVLAEHKASSAKVPWMGQGF